MKLKALALGAAVAGLACGSAHASIIIYELTANATYTLAGVSHTGMIDIQGTGDTANVVSQPRPGGPPPHTLEANGTLTGVDNAPFSISITLAGLGVYSVTGTSYAFDLLNGSLAGFGTNAGSDFIYIRTAMLDTYDMVSALAAVSGNFVGTGGSSVGTSGGQLAISSYDTGQFSARVTEGSLTPPPSGAPGVPEPATWAILLLGFSGLGAALRARRRTLAAVA